MAEFRARGGRGRARTGASRRPAGKRAGRQRHGLVAGHALYQIWHTEHPAGYQSYFEITQGPGALALRSEMIHDVRISRPNGVPHISPVIRQYHGDSRATWDGDTLVVDTTNYMANATRVGATDKLHTIEKFRRVAEDTLEYSVTFDDPTVWSQPWTLMIPLKMTGERMFEYACHEGNYGLRPSSAARASRRSRRGLALRRALRVGSRTS